MAPYESDPRKSSLYAIYMQFICSLYARVGAIGGPALRPIRPDFFASTVPLFLGGDRLQTAGAPPKLVAPPCQLAVQYRSRSGTNSIGSGSSTAGTVGARASGDPESVEERIPTVSCGPLKTQFICKLYANYMHA
jgi:hypothetical protein